MTKEISLINGQYLYLSEYNQIINSSFKDIFLSSQNKPELELIKQEITEETLKEEVKNIPHLIIETTQDCNLRCKYCVFNDNYHHQRPFNPSRMTREIAFKGIDYIYSIIKDRKKEFNIGFYGGEPLLNFDLIKDVVAYAKNQFKGLSLSFGFTTNLTILNDHILDFLVENDFRILVSLDGSSQNHDSKRVFKNGGGTYSTIINNLEKIKTKNPDYYKDNISFSAVHCYDLDLRDMRDFFNENELVKDKILNFNAMSLNDTSYNEKYPYDKQKKKVEIEQIISELFDKLRKKIPIRGIEQTFLNAFLDKDDKLSSLFYSNTANTCLFNSRLILDTFGNFHVCEKVNNKFPIGDVDHGFNYKEMVRILNSFIQLIEENCSDCEIQIFCSRCFSPFANDGVFKIPENFCEERKKVIVRDLERYITLKEEGLIQ